MNLLNDLNANGTTIIMVTHSQRDATYAQRVIRLFDGQIINENILKKYSLSQHKFNTHYIMHLCITTISK